MTTVFGKDVSCQIKVSAEDHKIFRTAAMRKEMGMAALMQECIHLAAQRLHKAEIEYQKEQVYKNLLKEENRYRAVDGKLKPGSRRLSELMQASASGVSEVQ